MGVYVFSRKVLLDMLARDDAKDFGREIIPAALGQFRVQSHLFGGYWADVGTVGFVLRGEHHADAAGRAVQVLRSAPADLYAPALPAGLAVERLLRARRHLAEGCYLDHCTVEESIVGIRTTIQPGAVVRRSVLLGADFYEADDDAATGGGARRSASAATSCSTASSSTRMRASATACGWSTRGLLREFDGDGFFIRNGVIVVPKDGVIPLAQGRRGYKAADAGARPSRMTLCHPIPRRIP